MEEEIIKAFKEMLEFKNIDITQVRDVEQNVGTIWFYVGNELYHLSAKRCGE